MAEARVALPSYTPPANDYIVSTPGMIGGRPRIAGRRIGVHLIVLEHVRFGKPIERLANSYDLTPAQIHAALAYYYDHQEEIERLLEADDHAEANAPPDPEQDELWRQFRAKMDARLPNWDVEMTVSEVAETYGLTPRAVREAAAKGWIPARKSGATWLIGRLYAEARWGKKPATRSK